MANDDGDPIFDYSNVIIELVFLAAVIFIVRTCYRFIAVCFRHQERTTTHQNPPQPTWYAASLTLNERTSSSVVHEIPTHKYHRRNKVDMVSDDDSGTCAVCLGDFEEGEELRTMPECLHSFHVLCIDMWLHSHLSCPICRASAAPLPVVHKHHCVVDTRNMVPLAIVQNEICPRRVDIVYI
ncbi:RING-H2 finger protein ATL1-like [Trifolium pratense]|uniref:RING-H2 finger protein ATL1-like n=1 Tax=Trifolium pratense TaxID=57577 RepID=UPI001E6930BA|nr:RING-H2 finger protein ATL1-like [Trifolium pratense]